MTSPRFVDSLVASEFEVHLNGALLNGIFQIQNFVSFQLDAQGNRLKPAFALSKMVQRDAGNMLNTWLRETTSARQGADRPTRELTIKAVDDGVTTRTWVVKGAYIQAIHYSVFDVASSELVAETLTIAYDDIEESFPG